MKSALFITRKRSFFVFLAALCCFWSTQRSLAQCAVTSPPSYSVSCLNQYFTSITASGTGVTSTIGYTGSSCAGTYFDYYASQGVTIPSGNTVSINISRYTTTYIAYITVYVDWNNNGIYDATELAGTMQSLSASTLSTVYSFAVPATGVVTGTNLHMRVMMSEVSGGAPCNANYGESCDFYLNVNCPSAPVITVSPAAPQLCAGGTGTILTASGAGTGGTYSWAPATGLSATAGASVTANPAVTTVYTVTGTVGSGCISGAAPVTVTVYPMPGGITGPAAVCAGSSITLGNTVTGGTWSSSNNAVATADPVSGIVYGVATGNATISYTSGGSCTVAMTIAVNQGPSPIAGATSVCAGYTTALSNAVAGGVWTSDNVAVATVSNTGTVSGVSSGTANISYTIGACTVTIPMTVNAISPIIGGSNVCAGSLLALSDATAGGVWSSVVTAVATVSGGGLVTGIVSGSSAIVYTIGACSVSVLVAVGNPVAVVTASADTTFCIGSAIVLYDATPGGTWISEDPAVATVSGVGIVRGVAAGNILVSYTMGGCSATIHIAVDAPGAGTIAGKDSICIGAGHAITLSDATAGGVWSSSSTARAAVDPVTGLVIAALSGLDTIKYTVVNSCGTFVAAHLLRVRTPAQCATATAQITAAEADILSIYPNPNNGNFVVSLSAATDQDMQITVTNMAGEKVQQLVAATNKPVSISLHQPAGLYLIAVSTAHGWFFAKVQLN